MKHVKVLGMGCATCKSTIQLIQQVVDELGVEVQLEKVESLPEIMKYKVMSTPAVVIDDKVVHAGGIPAREAVQRWF
ncbi:thioredoxin family protein [Aeromonas sp. S19(2024)]|uniref:thioredoxin family protein n=1 Tax=Aeromonas sp. S19(2024) TaxID=3242892 RepID=UPI0035271B14